MTTQLTMSGLPGASRPASLSRRSLVGVIGLGAVTVVLQGCGGGDATTGSQTEHQSEGAASSGNAVDYSIRFAAFEPADEPNGDLSKVVWPDFVLQAGADVKRLYEFQVLNGGLMRYMPCFCGCKDGAGHRNNRDCYIKSVSTDGLVVFDAMAPT